MDKASHSSGDSTTTTSSSSNSNSNNKDKYLNQLNKISHKISKPTLKKQSFNQPTTLNNVISEKPQQQPPVFNINKTDFRELVQKLTGSPAPDQSSSTTTTQQQPQTSRLHRIRPPPLAQITNRRPSCGFGRPVAPLSPLPPFHGVESAAESPVTAYLRNFLSSTPAVDSSNPRAREFSGFAPLGPLDSPRWSSLIGSHLGQAVHPPQGILALSMGVIGSQPLFQFPPSPLPFGCLLSPSGKLPLSPTVPVPSPK